MNTNQKLPSDRLMQRTHPGRIAAIISAAVLAVAVGTGAGSVWVARQANTAPAPRAVAEAPLLSHAEVAAVGEVVADSQQAQVSETQREEAAAAAVHAAELAAGHQLQADGGPVKCAPGYTANAVDADGNESNCQKNGPGNEPCVAYDDANNCTQYYKP